VSLYGDAIRALRQVILLDERVRNTAVDPAAMSQAVADLHDSVSRLEGMVAAVMAPSHRANPPRARRRLPEQKNRSSICEAVRLVHRSRAPLTTTRRGTRQMAGNSVSVRSPIFRTRHG